MRVTHATLAILATGSAAHAGSNEIALVETTRALRSPSADALTPDSLEGGGLRYARALGAGLPDGFALWAEAGFEVSTASGTMFHSLTTDIVQSAYTVGARLAYAPLHRVAVSARVALGTTRESLTIGDPTSASLSDYAWGELALGAVAVDVRAIEVPRFALALRLELGYTKVSRVALSPRAPGPSDGTLTIPVMDASLGHLDLSGPSASLSVVSQF